MRVSANYIVEFLERQESCDVSMSNGTWLSKELKIDEDSIEG